MRESYLHLLEGQRVGLISRPIASTITAMAALDAVGAHAYLLDPAMDQATRTQIVSSYQLTRCIDPARDEDHVATADGSFASKDSRVTILTSGTEGQPKAATHTWATVARPVRRGLEDQTWMLAYRLHLYAGLQVMLQALLNGGTLVMPAVDAHPDELVRMMREGHVYFVSATPSYWRRLLMFGDRVELEQLPLRQITLGGEAVDQPILDQLRMTFPRARIVHIYATTELGRCFAVSDGRAGFPQHFLDQPQHDGAELRVDQGQLYVRSRNRMLGYDQLTESAANSAEASGVGSVESNPWIATGDLVDFDGDRVYFAGRSGDIINVGGNKVRPVVVERYLRTIAGVRDVRVYGKSSSLAGQLVACDIVAEVEMDRSVLLQKIHEDCRSALASHEIPRIVQFVAEIPTSSAGKIIRNDG